MAASRSLSLTNYVANIANQLIASHTFQGSDNRRLMFSIIRHSLFAATRPVW
jgi:hypothetical protein